MTTPSVRSRPAPAFSRSGAGESVPMAPSLAPAPAVEPVPAPATVPAPVTGPAPVAVPVPAAPSTRTGPAPATAPVSAGAGRPVSAAPPAAPSAMSAAPAPPSAPAGAGEERLVRTLGTTHIMTRVLAVPGGGFVWSRRPGAARSLPLGRPDAATAALVAAACEAAPARLALAAPPNLPAADTPGADGDGTGPGAHGRRPIPADRRPDPVFAPLRYRMPAAFPLVRLLHDPQQRSHRAAQGALRAFGATLRRLHRTPAPAVLTAPVPAGPARLAAWLATGRGPVGAAHLHAKTVTRLGTARVEEMLRWCATSAQGPGPRVLLHGGPAMGLMAVPPRHGRAALLTGEELLGGSWEFDVAWLLAEITELATGLRYGNAGVPDVDYNALTWAFLDGYGRTPPVTTLRRMAALKILTHAHDFAAFVLWHDDLLTYLDMTAETFDAAAECG
jgi:hypothetical protein